MTGQPETPQARIGRKQERFRALKRLLTGRPLQGRVGHYCVGGRCKAARVTDQNRDLVDLVLVGGSEQQRVKVLNERSKERSFHLLSECDKIELRDGEYRDVSN